jgi:ParB/RepB/Spo0J family partition protein
MRILKRVKRDPKTLKRAENYYRIEDEEIDQAMVGHIKANGVFQDVLAREMPDGSEEVVAGWRRVRHAVIAELKEIPVSLVDGPMSDEDAAFEQFFENALRKDMLPTERAYFYKDMLVKTGMNHKQLAQRLGGKRFETDISYCLKLLKLPPDVLPRVGVDIPFSTAVQLANLESDDVIRDLAGKAASGVFKRDAARRKLGGRKKGPKGDPKPRSLKCRFGSLTIVFHDLKAAVMRDDAHGLLGRLERMIALKLTPRSLPDLLGEDDGPATVS